MAVHDFECPRCGYRKEDVFLQGIDGHMELCPNCLILEGTPEFGHLPMVQSFKNYKGWKPFRPYIDQHIAETPVEITSREQRRDLMKKNNLVDPAVGQGEPGCMV